MRAVGADTGVAACIQPARSHLSSPSLLRRRPSQRRHLRNLYCERRFSELQAATGSRCYRGEPQK